MAPCLPSWGRRWPWWPWWSRPPAGGGEPVDSLLRAVPARHRTTGAGVVEIALVVFSLTAVVALVTGRLEGPLATLAPTLLAVATGLLLGRALGPVTRLVTGRLLKSGRAVAAAGIVNAVRRPAARRVLAMVVVAIALLAFCVDAMVTGQHNRQSAAEQANGAKYSLRILSTIPHGDLVAALQAADPNHRHLTPVVTTTDNGSLTGPTVAVDPVAFPRVAYFPLSRPGRGDWDAIRAPGVEPVVLSGETLAGTVASDDLDFSGFSSSRPDELKISLQLRGADEVTTTAELSVIPLLDGSAPFSASLPCDDGCTVTGVVVRGPIGSEIRGGVVLRDLSVDGRLFSLGPTTAWRRMSDESSSVVPVADPDGNLGVNVMSESAIPPAMLSAWVPDPIPALVSGDETGEFSAPGPKGEIDLAAAGHCRGCPAQRSTRGSSTWRRCRDVRRGITTLTPPSRCGPMTPMSSRGSRASSRSAARPWAR